MQRQNEDVAWLLESIAELVGFSGDSVFKVRAYREAARAISAMREDIVPLLREDKLQDIPGVGPRIARIITEYLTSGESGYYLRLKQQVSGPVAALLEVPGVGPLRTRQLVRQLHVGTASELEGAAAEHRLRELPGFGAKLEERIGTEARRVARRVERVSLARALPAAEQTARLLRQHPAVLAVEPAGSLRRMKETEGDIDLLAASECPEKVAQAFSRLPLVREVLSVSPARSSILTRDRMLVDLRVVKPEAYGAALLHFTGSKQHNVVLRRRALSRGWKLSEAGLFDAAGGRIAGLTEESIYQALGMDWIPPELRENRGEVEAALAHELPLLVTQAQVRGDLHVHTNWSNGHNTLKEMVEAAIAHGYEYIAVTDRSAGVNGVPGLSVEQVRLQAKRIAEINGAYRPFRVLHGAEVGILAGGRLAYPDDLLAQLDLVAVTLSRGPKLPPHLMTRAVVAAVRNPNVHILLHLADGLSGSGQESPIDLDAAMQAAAEYGVALEVNGRPDGLGLDGRRARTAVGLGIGLALGTDAHARVQLDSMRYAVATARRAWAEPDQVLNTLPLAHLLTRLRRRGVRAAA